MIRDLEKERPQPGERADVCIIGSGAAGIVLAVELRRLGKRVLLLEAGGETIEEPSQQPYQSQITGLKHDGIHIGRFRAKGGTTTRWGGQLLEYEDQDFEVRPWIPGSGWPLKRSELKRFYDRATELEGMDGVLRNDQDVWRTVNEPEPHFPDLETYFTRWTPEPNFAILHAATLESAEVMLWLHANVVELRMDGERATGVRAKTLTGIEASFEADQYVFCLGTIESSRFFLQPRKGGLPWNRSGLLGKNYQDHVDTNAATVLPKSPKRFHSIFDNVFQGKFKYHPKLRLEREVQERLQTLNVGATMMFLSDADEKLVKIRGTAKNLLKGRFGQLTAADLASTVGNLPLLFKQAWRYAVEHRAYNPLDATIKLRIHCEQEPINRSTITLADSRDELGMLRTRLDWRVSDTELRTIRTYAEVAQKALVGLAAVEIHPDLQALSPAYYSRCEDSYHQMGGMRMDASETAGVVDPDLRLHGTRNAFCCSCAVFPTSGYSNPTHTLLALAVRLAEHLA